MICPLATAKRNEFPAASIAIRYVLFWCRHTAGQSRDGFQTVSGSVGHTSGTTLTIALLYEPLGVCTVTTRTFPSCTGYTSVTHANGHLVGIVGSLRRHTISPTCKFCVGRCHFDNRFNVIKYSFDHQFQKSVRKFMARIPPL